MTTINSIEIPSGLWSLDPSHSQVGFSVRHAGISKVRGVFNDFAATVHTGDALEDVQVTAIIKTDSFSTGDPNRDAHVKSFDFFDVENFPELSFNSTRLVQSGKDFVLEGTLTIRDVSKEVKLDVEFNGIAVDPFGVQRLGLEAETTISRKDFGIVWNAALETGGVLVSDKVKINLDLSFAQA